MKSASNFLLLLLSLTAALAALEFSRGFSTHGGTWYLAFVALATIEFSRRYATLGVFPHYPALKRRAKFSRRSAAKSGLSSYFLFLILTVALNASLAFGQSELDKAPKPQEAKPARDRVVPGKQDKKPAPENPTRPITDAERQNLRREDQSEEEAAILPYINNFFATTRLGPEDVISVDVFDQPNYSRANLTIPPNGRISYPLIGQVMIAGRTTEDLEKEITEKLSEYIREPKVAVQIVQVHSLKYLVIGDVTTPGIYEMTRRMTVTEALAKAGYATRFGDLSKVAVLRMQKDGSTTPIPINIREVERGKLQDIYLTPGDTVVVPGNKFKTVDKLSSLIMLGSWMRVIVR